MLQKMIGYFTECLDGLVAQGFECPIVATIEGANRSKMVIRCNIEGSSVVSQEGVIQVPLRILFADRNGRMAESKLTVIGGNMPPPVLN